jgi:hypothetical protein
VAHAALHEEVDDALRFGLAARLGRCGERRGRTTDGNQTDSQKGARGVSDEFATRGLIEFAENVLHGVDFGNLPHPLNLHPSGL